MIERANLCWRVQPPLQWVLICPRGSSFVLCLCCQEISNPGVLSRYTHAVHNMTILPNQTILINIRKYNFLIFEEAIFHENTNCYQSNISISQFTIIIIIIRLTIIAQESRVVPLKNIKIISWTRIQEYKNNFGKENPKSWWQEHGIIKFPKIRRNKEKLHIVQISLILIPFYHKIIYFPRDTK